MPIKILRLLSKYVLVFVICIVSFLVLLTLVFCIPDSAIAANQQEALEVLGTEGRYPNIFFYRYASQLDNATDHRIFRTTRVQDPSLNAFEAAMSMNDYARYWHGSQVLLRPALVFLSYAWIRYINMFLLLFLLCICFSLLREKLGMRYAVAFVLTMGIICFVILPASLQFSPVFVLLLIASILVLRMYGTHPASSFPILFFLTGILTSFFDLLTAPLLTFGIPAICYVLLESKYNESATFGSNMKRLFWIGFAWLAGYGLCWASKWIITDLTLGTGAIMDAIETAMHRVGGVDHNGDHVNYPLLLELNLNALFPGAKSKLGLAALIGAFAGIAALFRQKKAVWARQLALLPLVLLPYAWYIALGNHSQMHFWFTCRAQAVAAFALFSFLFSVTDFARVKAFLLRFCPARKKKKRSSPDAE